MSHGPHILSTPELPQSKLAGRSAHVRRKVAAQGRMLPLLSGGSDGEESPPPPNGDGDECIDERNADGGGRADQNSTGTVLGAKGLLVRFLFDDTVKPVLDSHQWVTVIAFKL